MQNSIILEENCYNKHSLKNDEVEAFESQLESLAKNNQESEKLLKNHNKKVYFSDQPTHEEKTAPPKTPEKNTQYHNQDISYIISENSKTPRNSLKPLAETSISQEFTNPIIKKQRYANLSKLNQEIKENFQKKLHEKNAKENDTNYNEFNNDKNESEILIEQDLAKQCLFFEDSYKWKYPDFDFKDLISTEVGDWFLYIDTDKLYSSYSVDPNMLGTLEDFKRTSNTMSYFSMYSINEVESFINEAVYQKERVFYYQTRLQEWSKKLIQIEKSILDRTIYLENVDQHLDKFLDRAAITYRSIKRQLNCECCKNKAHLFQVGNEGFQRKLNELVTLAYSDITTLDKTEFRRNKNSDKNSMFTNKKVESKSTEDSPRKKPFKIDLEKTAFTKTNLPKPLNNFRNNSPHNKPSLSPESKNIKILKPVPLRDKTILEFPRSSSIVNSHRPNIRNSADYSKNFLSANSKKTINEKSSLLNNILSNENLYGNFASQKLSFQNLIPNKMVTEEKTNNHKDYIQTEIASPHGSRRDLSTQGQKRKYQEIIDRIKVSSILKNDSSLINQTTDNIVTVPNKIPRKVTPLDVSLQMKVQTYESDSLEKNNTIQEIQRMSLSNNDKLKNAVLRPFQPKKDKATTPNLDLFGINSSPAKKKVSKLERMHRMVRVKNHITNQDELKDSVHDNSSCPRKHNKSSFNPASFRLKVSDSFDYANKKNKQLEKLNSKKLYEQRVSEEIKKYEKKLNLIKNDENLKVI